MINQPIQLLDQKTAEQIAAGEVIEHPASVVKELVENSLDAGADRIEISLLGGGKRRIRVVDNGSGIAPAELELAFSRFATSKLTALGDLEAITSLGFRGEALPSIAAVSRVTLTTRRPGDLAARRIRREGGGGGAPEESGAPAGTEVIVEDLFFNTPGRLKFLRGAPREQARISSLVTALALARPDCAFTLTNERRTVLRTAGDGSLLHAIGALYGSDAAAAMLPLQRRSAEAAIQLSGFISAPHFSRASRRWVTVVINGRAVRCPLLVSALERAYGGMLGRGRYPLAVLVLQAAPALLDVNVHPAKSEVRFERPEQFNELLFRAARAALHALPLEGSAPEWSRKGKGQWDWEKEAAREGRLQQQQLLEPLQPPAHFQERAPGEELLPEGAHLFPGRGETAAADGAAGAAPAGGCRLIGQFLHSYLVAQKGEELLLIDQHAAHERVLYHRFTAAEPGQRRAQLTIPLQLELPPAWRERFAEIGPFLEEAGFSLEPFGDNSFILRAVPLTVKDEPEPEIHALFEQLLQGETAPGEDRRAAVLKTVACHRAVKARQPLERREAEQLLRDWETTPGAAHCPHGRPTVLRFHRAELDRGFHRRGGDS
ncbi:MAG: DNA mismatch repair endonuclease MutL [Firmicutes bacterium]|nr:DNA mismatch repair endonuclease MutL [Bacillota bacterium]